MASRDRVLNESEMQAFIGGIESGLITREIAERNGFTIHSVFKTMDVYPEFEKNVGIARMRQALLNVEELHKLTDGLESMADAAIARVKSENIRWSASKFDPKRFGDNLNVSVSHTLDLGPTLLAAQNRVIELQKVIEVPKPASINAPGSTIDAELVSEPVVVDTPDPIKQALEIEELF